MTQSTQAESFPLLDNRFNHKSKCFACERQIAGRCGEGRASLGMPSKCFDCQREMMEHTLGFNGGFGT